MNKNKTINSSLLLLMCGLSMAICSHAVVLKEANNLHLIKKIYIEVVSNTVEENKIEPLLKFELEMRGFTVLDSASSADAVLSGEIQAEVVLDGDGSVPHKAIYHYQLALPNQEVVWRAKIKFATKLDFAEDNRRAARSLAEKLSSDWEKSARKAARN